MISPAIGGETRIPASPEEAELERVRNPQADVAHNVRFTVPEYISLCLLSGQPDFAQPVAEAAAEAYSTLFKAAWPVQASSMIRLSKSSRERHPFAASSGLE